MERMEQADKRIDSTSLFRDQLQQEQRTRVRSNPIVPQFVRVNELWDERIHDFTLTETAAAPKNNDGENFIFQVRRRFDCDGIYLETLVDIKSTILRNILQMIMSSCKCWHSLPLNTSTA